MNRPGPLPPVRKLEIKQQLLSSMFLAFTSPHVSKSRYYNGLYFGLMVALIQAQPLWQALPV